MRMLKMYLACWKKVSRFGITYLCSELVLGLVLASLLVAPPCSAQNDLPSETPATLTPEPTASTTSSAT